MTVQLRDDLGGLSAYRQGRAPAPGDGATFKLSSNENPYPPLPSVVRRLAERLTSINRYPNAGAGELVTRICERYAVDPAQVMLGAGSVEVVSQLMRATAGAGDEIVFPWRSFEAYPLLTVAAGARPVQVPLTADLRHDLPAMRAAIGPRTRLVIVCNPNNPTGTTVGAAELEDFVASVPSNVAILVDEAYLHFNRDHDTARGSELFHRYPNVVVAHTFSKAYGLAGLRLGYALAPAAVVAAMRTVALPFGVTDLARAAGLASLQAEDELGERVASLVAERGRVLAELHHLGLPVPDSQANFVWLALGEHTDGATDCFARHNVLVRPFSGEGLRVTIGDAAANDALLIAAAEIADRLTAVAR